MTTVSSTQLSARFQKVQPEWTKWYLLRHFLPEELQRIIFEMLFGHFSKYPASDLAIAFNDQDLLARQLRGEFKRSFRDCVIQPGWLKHWGPVDMSITLANGTLIPAPEEANQRNA